MNAAIAISITPDTRVNRSWLRNTTRPTVVAESGRVEYTALSPFQAYIANLYNDALGRPQSG